MCNNSHTVCHESHITVMTYGVTLMTLGVTLMTYAQIIYELFPRLIFITGGLILYFSLRFVNLKNADITLSLS